MLLIAFWEIGAIWIVTEKSGVNERHFVQKYFFLNDSRTENFNHCVADGLQLFNLLAQRHPYLELQKTQNKNSWVTQMLVQGGDLTRDIGIKVTLRIKQKNVVLFS